MTDQQPLPEKRFFCITESERIMITEWDSKLDAFLYPYEHYGPVQQLILEGFSELSVRTFKAMGFVV